MNTQNAQQDPNPIVSTPAPVAQQPTPQSVSVESAQQPTPQSAQQPTPQELSMQEILLITALGEALNTTDVARLRLIASKLTKEQTAKLIKAAHAVKAPTWPDILTLGILQDIRMATKGVGGAGVALENATAKGAWLFLGARALIRKVF